MTHPPLTHPAGIADAFRNRWFVLCAALLIAFTAGFQFRFRNTQFRKEALPLKAALSSLDHQKLSPYRVAQVIAIQPDMLDALGTKDYIQWFLTDGSLQREITRQDVVCLFVTYYTGKPDQVPHVPEQCMLGSGFTEVENKLVTVRIPHRDLPEKDREVPVQALRFEKRSFAGLEGRVVMYTFRTNDQWCPSRDCVRAVIGNPFATHAYFSKLELAFDLSEANGAGGAGMDQAIEAGRRFLEVAVPVLMKDHWPDWDTAVHEKASAIAAADAERR